MTRASSTLGAGSALALLALTAAGCNEGSSGSAPPPAAASSPAAVRAEAQGAGLAALGAAGQGSAQVSANAVTSEDPALVELGKLLFFDPILSGNRTIACSTCHHPTTGTSDDLPLSIGEGGRGLGTQRVGSSGGAEVPRNSPAVFNLGDPSYRVAFWDGRLSRAADGSLLTPDPALNGLNPPRPGLVQALDGSLAAAQAMFPVTSFVEMRGQPGTNPVADAPSNEEVWRRLTIRLVGDGASEPGIAEYVQRFAAAYPGVARGELNFGHVARALAAFEVSVFRADETGLDRFLRGDDEALAAAELRGLQRFVEIGCADCHGGPALSDFEFHALCTPQLGPGKVGGDDTGRFLVTGLSQDRYAFRTPPLRNVAVAAPYFHAGSHRTLEGALRHHLDAIQSARDYDPEAELPPRYRGLLDRDPARQQERESALSGRLAPRFVSDSDLSDLIAFLRGGLSDERSLRADIAPNSVPSGLPVGGQ